MGYHMLRINKALSNPFHLEEKEKEFYDCKRMSVGKGSRAEEGILVGFESNFRPTYTYKIYLPH